MDFRKIDVDQYDDEALLDSDLVAPDARPPAQILADAKAKSAEVRGLIQRGDAKGALAAVLGDAPYGAQAADATSTTLGALLDILNSTKSSDIAGLVRQLSIDEQDTLMKYIYKGLGSPELGASAVLLGWHEKLTEVAGTGCIVRVMTDHRRV